MKPLQVEAYKQPPDVFDSSGWKREKSRNPKVAQNSFEILGNRDYFSYDEIGPEDTEFAFGGLKSEDGLIKNIFTYEDDDNEIHVDYIAYDESESLPEIPKGSTSAQLQGERGEESGKLLVPALDVKLERIKTKNFFKNDRKPSKNYSSKFLTKKKVVDQGKERNPHLTKKKKKKAIEAGPTEEDGLTARPEKADSTLMVSDQSHKKRLKNFSQGLLRQFFKVPPGVMLQQEKEQELGGKALHRVYTFVGDLTNFATSYNKLATVLLQGQ